MKSFELGQRVRITSRSYGRIASRYVPISGYIVVEVMLHTPAEEYNQWLGTKKSVPPIPEINYYTVRDSTGIDRRFAQYELEGDV